MWYFLCLERRQVGFWCRCTWFGFWGPNWFDRITHQAQLCGSWETMSHCGTPSFGNYLNPLLRCPQTNTTKLPDAKIGRLREHNQYYSTRWSFLEIVWLVRDLCLCSQGQKQSDPTNRERETRLISNPASKEMISDSVELWETAVCFLHINLLEQKYDFQKHTMFLQKWILNPQDLPAKSESWNSPSLHCFAILPT